MEAMFLRNVGLYPKYTTLQPSRPYSQYAPRWKKKKEEEEKKTSVALVRERTIPTERPPLFGEVSVNFCG
jgi:hypothetical protein